MEKNIFMKRLINTNISKDGISGVGNKRGSYTIEAALVFPFVIVGILTLSYIIYSVYVTEDIGFISCDEGKKLALTSYNIKSALGFEQTVKKRIYDENSNVENVNVYNLNYLYNKNGIDDMISMDVDYKIKINLPLDFNTQSVKSDSFLFRGFTGKTSKWEPRSFDDMEGEGKIVWVFPEGGTKYHTETCTYVNSNYRIGILTDDIKDKYNSCEICDSKNANVGSIIFYFPSYGESYHLEGCSTIEKYTIYLEENQAIERGYSPCIKCGG